MGISFYTFQTLSYTLDIYRDDMEPTRDPVAFFAFVSFFPQLVAGPIERATHLLPQFTRIHTFQRTTAVTGVQLILIGLFKKSVIADNLAVFADYAFSTSGQHAVIYLLGAVSFTWQIYCDFSGYSDIAIGSGALLGFRLSTNFRAPFFATTITELWQRWHISLTEWLRDYLYLPLSIRFRYWAGGEWQSIC